MGGLPKDTGPKGPTWVEFTNRGSLLPVQLIHGKLIEYFDQLVYPFSHF